jgi:hypothetical protein
MKSNIARVINNKQAEVRKIGGKISLEQDFRHLIKI